MQPIPKTYTATIKVTFEAWENENPRAIAREMAVLFDGTRDINLHIGGEVTKIVEEKS